MGHSREDNAGSLKKASVTLIASPPSWIELAGIDQLNHNATLEGIERVVGAPDLHEKDIVYQTLRASGPGGQHVNKTESAVRATHVPTELAVVSQEQRSQQANRKVARLKLSLLLEQRRAREQVRGRQALWSQHQSLERGNEVRSYEGVGFRLRK